MSTHAVIIMGLANWNASERVNHVYTRDRGLKHVPEKVNNSDCKHPNFCHVLLVINR